MSSLKTWYGLVYVLVHTNVYATEDKRITYRPKIIALSEKKGEIDKFAESIEKKLGHPYINVSLAYVIEHLEKYANKQFFIPATYSFKEDRIKAFWEDGRILDSANFRLRI